MNKKFLTAVITLFFLLNIFINVKAAGYGDFVLPVTEEHKKIDSGDYSFLLDSEKNNYTGKFKDKSLVIVEVDGLLTSYIDRQAAGSALTPGLNRLVSESTYFSNYFLSSASKNVGDVVLSTLYSIYPNQKYPGLMQINGKSVKGLQHYFNDLDYNTIAIRGDFQNNKINYINLGFKEATDEKFNNNREVFNKILSKIDEGGKKFIYAETLSSENPTTVFKGGNFESEKNEFVAKIRTLDDVLNEFILNFKKSPKSKDTILVLVGKNSVIDSQQSKTNAIKTMLTMDVKLGLVNTPLVFVNGIGTSKNINTIGTVDILPTLKNLFDFNKNIYPMFGKDAFSSKKTDMDMTSVQFDLNNRMAIYKSVAINLTNGAEGMIINSYNRNDLSYIDHSSYDLVIKKSFKDSSLSYGLTSMDKLKEIATNKKLLKIDSEKAIMHAGGEINGMTYTNMKEALDKSYQAGKRILEMDFVLSKEKYPVNMHSWEGFVTNFFGVTYEPKKTFTKSEFDSFKSRHGYTQMDIAKVLEWLRNHPDAKIITDVKEDNLKVLKQISLMDPYNIDRVIPQIYKFEEYEKVKEFGFKNIVLTLYLSNYSAEQLIDFAKNNHLFGITMSLNKYQSGLGKKLIDEGIDVFVHTINNLEKANLLINEGVKRVYTDTL